MTNIQPTIPVIDGDRIIMSVKTVDEGLDGWLVEMTKIGCGLTWFLAQHHLLWVDESECVNNNLSFHTLYGIHHDCNCTCIQRLKTLMGNEHKIYTHSNAPVVC